MPVIGQMRAAAPTRDPVAPCAQRTLRTSAWRPSVGHSSDNGSVSLTRLLGVPASPVTVSTRTFRAALESAMMSYTRDELEVVLADELQLTWPHQDSPSDPRSTKRDVIRGYTTGWDVPQLAALARRVIGLDVPPDELVRLLAEYDRRGTGVTGPVKNLIFAANGPKPELVLRDAISNDIEIVRNAQFCLTYDQPVPDSGLRFQDLIDWWRSREQLAGSVSDQDVGRALHARLRESLDGNTAERALFDAYATRYRASFDIPALIPQVYLHYDPYTRHDRRLWGEGPGPLARQRMDFLILFSDRRRVVMEVDGKQHYSRPDGHADPRLYAQMVAEDRRLRLAGYEVYRFGGAELAAPGADATLAGFFEQLADRMR